MAPPNGGFAMVPAWLLDKKPDGNDILIYCTLARYGTFNTVKGVYEECRPSVPSLVEDTGKSESTIRRALKNLEGFKAIQGRKQFNDDSSPAPTIYTVIFGRLVGPDDDTAPDQDLSPVTGGGSTGDTSWSHGRNQGVVPPVEGKQEVSSPTEKIDTHITSDAAAPADDAKDDGKPVRPEVQELCELLADRIVQRGGKRPTIGKRAVDACRRLMDLDGYTAEQVRYLIEWSHHHKFWSGVILSMSNLREHADRMKIQAKREHEESTRPTSGGAPARSFQQREREHKLNVSDLIAQALERWRAENPGEAPSPAVRMRIMTAAQDAVTRAESAKADVSRQPTMYSDAIEGESVETEAPRAIEGGTAA